MEETQGAGFSAQPDSTVYVILTGPNVLAMNDDGVVAFQSFSVARENAQAMRGQVRRFTLGELLEACRADKTTVVLVMADGTMTALNA